MDRTESVQMWPSPTSSVVGPSDGHLKGLLNHHNSKTFIQHLGILMGLARSPSSRSSHSRQAEKLCFSFQPGCLASPSSWDDKWPTVGVKTFDKEILLHFGEALIFGGPEAAGKAPKPAECKMPPAAMARCGHHTPNQPKAGGICIQMESPVEYMAQCKVKGSII